MRLEIPSKLRLFFISGLFISATSYAEGNMASQQLIRHARLDSLAFLAMPRSLYPRALPSDPDLLEARACFASDDGSGFAEILGDAADKTMSAEELQTAHQFFESTVGRKYGDLRIWQARSDLGLVEVDSVPEFSKQEEVLAKQFLATSAGIKMSTRALIAVPGTPLRLFELTAKIVRECIAKKKHD